MSQGQNAEQNPTSEPPVLEMRIVAEMGKPMKVYFPLFADKVITYGFLKIAEKVLDAYYADQEKSKIALAKGSMLNFARFKR